MFALPACESICQRYAHGYSTGRSQTELMDAAIHPYLQQAQYAPLPHTNAGLHRAALDLPEVDLPWGKPRDQTRIRKNIGIHTES